MKFLLVIFFALFCLSIHAHNEHRISISEVQLGNQNNCFNPIFSVKNNYHKAVDEIEVQLFVNGQMLRTIDIKSIDAEKSILTSLSICEYQFNSNDSVKIIISKVFGRSDVWDEWNNLNPTSNKQTNTAFSEFYVDAPWRMKKTDQSGNLVGIPVHFFLHDADQVQLMDLQIDQIKIRLKNASSTSFDPVLTFNNWAEPDFQALFSCMSETDPALYIRAFDLNSLSPTSSATIDFDIESDFFNDYVTIYEKYWYFTFTIPASVLSSYEDVVDISVQLEYGNLTIADTYFGMRVFRSESDLPKLLNYYRGDTHLHSMYTQNDAEIGLPLCATKDAAKLIGIDWITTTDHTSDYDNYGVSIQDNWNRIQMEASQLNANDNSMIFVAGQEVAVNNSANKLVHMLAYPNPMAPYSLPFIGDGDGDIFSTSVSVSTALDSIVSNQGFAYAAHPFATEDELPEIPVNGGIWNVGSDLYSSNGFSFVNGGIIICNDLTLPSDVLYSLGTDTLIKNGLKGGQIWNARHNLEFTGDELDPWDVDNIGGGFSQMDTSQLSFHWKRFKQGQEIINAINQRGLIEKNTNPQKANWKMYYSAGTDAHGSFNFSNTDDFAALGSISNNAVGKMSTVVQSYFGMGPNGEYVLEGLSKGRSTLSDGPLLTMGLSTNGDDAVSEVLLGEDTELWTSSMTDHFVNFDFATTTEFGAIREFKVILGTENGEITKVMHLTDSTNTFNQSYNLVDLLDSISPNFIIPFNEFMYLRAEILTTIDYSSQPSRRMQYDQFHSITNPVWFKYQDDAGVNEAINESLKIYPNPTKEKLFIETTKLINSEYLIFDQFGKTIFSGDLHEKLTSIDLTGISQGVYTIQITQAANSIHKKFIKF